MYTECNTNNLFDDWKSSWCGVWMRLDFSFIRFDTLSFILFEFYVMPSLLTMTGNAYKTIK